MKKRAFAAFLAAILLLGILPGTALAAEPKGDISSTGLTINSVDAAKSAVGSYTTGSGTVEVAYDETANTVTFTLNNATLNGPFSVYDVNVAIVLNGENSITVDGKTNAIYIDSGSLTISGEGAKLTAESTEYPTIWSSGDIVVDGSSVQANSDSSNGFFTNSSIQLKNGAAVSGECGYPLLYATSGIQICGSTVKTEVWGGWGIWSDNGLTICDNSKVDVTGYGAIGAAGVFSIENSKVTAYSNGGSGLWTGDSLTISGDGTVVTATSEAESWTDEGNDGTTYSYPGIVIWGDLAITGGTVTASAVDAQGIQCSGDLEISGTKTKVDISNTSDRFMALRVDGDITITGGTTKVSSSGNEGIYPKGDLTLSGGSLSVNSQGHGLYMPDNTLYVRDGELNVVSYGEDEPGIRSGAMNISGGKISVDCPNAKYPIALNEDGLTYTGGELNLPNVRPEEGIQIGNDVHYFLVIFHPQNGENRINALIKEGETIAIDAPERTNFIFKGWYDAPSGGTQWDLEHGTVKTNMTLHAQWISLHQHTWTDEWTSNETHHWHACVGEDCPIISNRQNKDYNPHTPGEAATSTAPQTCTVCGYVMAPALSSPSGGGSSVPTYKPEVTRPGAGGSVSISTNNPKRGDPVVITPKPDAGYEVDEIIVTDQNGNAVEVKKNSNGTYTFIQPSSRVKIEVTYKLVNKPWNNPFTDVSEGDWYYEAVRFAQERGLMNGYSDGRFGPNDILSRAQLAQTLFNKEGRPGVNYLMDFSDVAGEAWYTEAIRWATSLGIAGGYGNGTFGPNDPITREQLAVMLWRYSGSPAATGKELHFADADKISGFALEAMCWAVENGILNGYGDERLGPQGQATRAQVAQMLKNFIENH